MLQITAKGKTIVKGETQRTKGKLKREQAEKQRKNKEETG